MAKSMKQISREEGSTIKRDDLFKVPLDELVPDEENIRIQLEGVPRKDLDEHIEAMVETLMAGGTLPPLAVYNTDDNRTKIHDGHQRREAYIRARARGKAVNAILCYEFKGNNSDRKFGQVTAGKGLGYSQLELALRFKELHISLNHTVAEIAKRTGNDRANVERLLVLGKANRDVHLHVLKDHISADEAIALLRQHGESTGAIIDAELAKAAKIGKTRVTKATMQGRNLPKAQVTKIVTYVENFAQRLPLDTMRALAEVEALPEAAREGKTVPVDANTLLDLMQFHNEAKATRERQAQKLREKEARASQSSIDDGTAGQPAADEQQAA
ncbi:ParB/RepB/Spo0J family partition protein [Burkholderia cepacia]|uniref:ParB/RepB/Spo0J family partition protein n=1 Tax=Burkholderia cepacia TaxID=292 RepID=UPI002AB622CE|nr:ParB N-terminal domain-containing protein [Burkholderia cepacia]